MSADLYTSRTPSILYQRCPRARYLGYELPNGTPTPGLEPARPSLALSVGGAVHEGLAYLLSASIQDAPLHTARDADSKWWRMAENAAVEAALLKFTEASGAGLEPEMGERLAQAPMQASPATTAEEWGTIDQVVEAHNRQVEAGSGEFDAYLAKEQACLVEGLVRAWARRGLPRLLGEYEVLEVEREGQWRLGTVVDMPYDHALWFQSRPDALLRHRQTGDLVIQSFKTTGAWDARKARDAERDLQGLTEGVEVEQRLGLWWQWSKANSDVANAPTVSGLPAPGCTERMAQWLQELPAPPRISAIRYEYLLKGQRSKASRVAKALATRLGFEAWVQQSPLAYLWVSPGMTIEDAEVAHSFAWTDPDGREHKLAWQKWQQRAVWEQVGGIKAWVDLLDSGAVQPLAGRDVLGEQCLPPTLVYRTDDDLLDIVEQLEAQEVQVAQDAAAVASAEDEGARRSELNRRFPQTRTACSYPGECAFVPVCYGGMDARRDPLSTGKYRARTVNHPVEIKEAVNEQ